MTNVFKKLTALLIILLLQFTSILPFIQRVESASAEESCKLASSSSPSSALRSRVGGVALDQAAKFLADMTDITGAYYDESKDKIVFVGKKGNSTLPKFDKDNLAIAIKIIIFENSLPWFSLEDYPADETKLEAVYGSKSMVDTKFGKVFFDADYQMKKYSMGKNEDGSTVTSSVPGYKSFSQLYVEYGPDGNAFDGSSRWWITPQYISLKRDDAASAFVFDTVKMQVKTEATAPNNGSSWTRAANDFAQHHTDHFDEFANETSSYREIKQLGKIAAVVKWIKDSGITSDFHWARDYSPKIMSTPKTIAKLPNAEYEYERDGFIYTGAVTGGATLDLANDYLLDNGTSAAIKQSSQTVPTTKEDIHWTFIKDNQQYEAVAVTADAFRSVGSYDTVSADMSFPVAGDLNLNFTRAYSSFSGGQQGAGRGWNIFPAQLMITNFSADSVPCGSLSNPKQLGFYSQGGGWESFTFVDCITGYTTDDPAYHSKVFHNTDGTFTVRLKNQTEYIFDSLYTLKSIKDKNGNLVNYSYNSSNKLTSIADTKSHTITFSYNAQNWISEATDWSGRKVKYSYDDQGNLLTVTDPNGNITTYTYDANFKLVSIKDGNDQAVITNTYTDEAKLATQKNAVDNTATYNYDKVNRVVTVADNQTPSRIQTTKYDSKARILEQSDPLAYKLTYTYGSEYPPLTIKDKNGSTVTNTYDSNGNLATVTFPDTKKITYQYDIKNRLTKIIDERYGTPGKDTTNTYDAAGNLTQINQAGLLTKFTYDASGEALTLTDPLNQVTTWTRDSLGNKLTEKDAVNNVASFEYDLIGRLKKKTDADAKITSLTYDNNGNLLTLNDGVGTTTNFYDKENRLVKTVLPDNTVNEFAYNPLGSLISTKDQALNISSYGYDTYQNLTTQTDALAKISVNNFDALNRQTQSTTPMGMSYKYEYDANGNITKRFDANNAVTAYQYDAFNRLIKITYPDITTVTFSYDNRGNRVQMVDAIGTSSYVYDNFNRLTQATNGYGKILKYTYDNANNLRTIVYPENAGTVTYTYDNNNQLISVKDLNGKVTAYTYNKNGTLATRLLPNSILTTYSYDSANRVNTINHTKSTTTLAKFVYTRNNLGNITDIVESGSFVASTPQTTSFTYDVLGRITKATYPGNKVFEYTYDKMGNRLTQKVDNTVTTSYEYDNDHKVVKKMSPSQSLISYSYDNNGNQSIKPPPGNIITVPIKNYDFDNRLKSYTISSANSTYYKYDGLGNRLNKKSSLSETEYTYDISGSLSQLLYSKQKFAISPSTWVYGLGLIKEGSSKYFLEDGSGNMRFTTSSTGSKSGNVSYDPFGNILTSSGTLSDFRFNMQQQDSESKLYFLRARYYDPEDGRFISRDPVKGDLAQPQTLNPYSYAINNPIILSDPSGEQYREWFLENLPTFTKWGQSISQACQKFFSSPAAVRTSQQLGRAGEAAAPIIKNTTKIESLTGTAGSRIPDELNVAQKVIGEVKNVQYQSLTNQLKDFNQYAQQNGYTFKLYTPEKTQISQPLQELIDSGQIQHILINP